MIPKSVFISVLTAAISCVPASSNKPCAESGSEGGSVTIFITGNELGAIKPCGCAGGQLGGLDRRGAIFDRADPAGRFILDTGTLIEGQGEQDLIKFNIVVQSFGLLGYDVVHLSEEDIQSAQELGFLEVMSSFFDVISSHSWPDVNIPRRFTKRISTEDGGVLVTAAAFNAEADQPEDIAFLFEDAEANDGDMSLGILIVRQGDAGVIEAAAEAGVDLVIVPPESDEPMLVSEPNARCMVISPGREGKYVGKVEARPNGDGLKLSFSSIPVEEDLPLEQSLVELYKSYQQLVKEAGLLEKYARFSLDDHLRYIGSRSCKLCHDYEYDRWSVKAHSDAYETLVKVGSQYDPECVICHVVGMKYDSGFVSESKTVHLKDVGCENCHGPGSEHVRSLGAFETTGPITVCTDCHTPEHSGEFAGQEDEYMKKIVHWREPVSQRKVDEREDLGQ